MAATPDPNTWPCFHFGLIVTGKGEEEFLPSLFRSLTPSGHCTFKVICRIGQRSPITSDRRSISAAGTDKKMLDKDDEQIGRRARRYLDDQDTFVLLVDDLEHDRGPIAGAVFGRYRGALDRVLAPGDRRRASVHFLANMLEAYYFADTAAINAVFGTVLTDHPDDVETIRNPKRELKSICSGFHEIRNGRDIIKKLNVEHVLSNHATCAFLRTLFAWCSKAIGEKPTERYQLVDGVRSDVTKSQIDRL